MWPERFIKKTLFRVYFYLNVGQKTRHRKLFKCYPKEWSRKHIFHPHFFIFLRNPKSMLRFLENSLRNGMVQEIMGKEVSLSVKMHFSVSGHVTLGMVRCRHELNHTCPSQRSNAKTYVTSVVSALKICISSKRLRSEVRKKALLEIQ